jgi:hypothetical protein
MFEPSAQIQSLLTAVALTSGASDGLRAIGQRESEFANPWEAKLTGIALDPTGRTAADQALDAYWADQNRQQGLLTNAGTGREIIIGSGFHAAVYAAVRVLSGFGKPLVLERGERPGGAFAQTARPTFYLNSRNRPGNAGLAGDQGANLNFLPGAPIQAANLSMTEYQSNAEMAFVIRLTLAQYADVVTGANVRSVAPNGGATLIEIDGRAILAAGRVIDARGLGDPRDLDVANGTTVVTFAQFMRRMAGPWPLRGVRRVAVIGGGDAAKCVIESCLGIAPQPLMAAATLDSVDRIDVYADDLPDTCDGWQREVRGRYQAIGRHLRSDRFGVRRLNVLNRRAQPVALSATALVDGCGYDLVAVCTGNRESSISGLASEEFDDYQVGGRAVAREHFDLPAFRVGPHARLPFTLQERADGVADIPANAVAMFRTAGRTAALAATLAPVVTD